MLLKYTSYAKCLAAMAFLLLIKLTVKMIVALESFKEAGVKPTLSLCFIPGLTNLGNASSCIIKSCGSSVVLLTNLISNRSDKLLKEMDFTEVTNNVLEEL